MPDKDHSFSDKIIDVEIKNCIKLLLILRGWNDYRPSKALLKELGMDKTRFNFILNNDYQPDFTETYKFSQWLQVNIQDLYSISIPKSHK